MGQVHIEFFSLLHRLRPLALAHFPTFFMLRLAIALAFVRVFFVVVVFFAPNMYAQ